MFSYGVTGLAAAIALSSSIQVAHSAAVDLSSVTVRSNNYKYLNHGTKKFLIESMPEVDFDFGEMYGGQVPIGQDDPSGQLYFIFKPAINSDVPNDEIVIWLNGGPGCSSMGGFLQENGPIMWEPGMIKPQSNPWSWANITNMLWVDQPVGAGFSTGKVNTTGEVDIAAQFVAWFENWQKTFGIKNYKIYVTGESYAGRYVPYISSAMLNKSNTEYFNLQGALVYDPVIGSFQYTQERVAAYPFILNNNNVMGLTDSQLAGLQQTDEKCGYAALREKYFQFPPPGHQPVGNWNISAKCDVWSDAINEISEKNHCFNIYSVNDQCPYLYDPLGFSGYNNGKVYFDRKDVKAAIHAPSNVKWALCGERATVFDKKDPPGPEGEGDASPDPIQNVLPQVIDATKRVLVGNGDLDMIIITNGTLMSIQNMTWGGQLGFQERPSTPINVKGKEIGGTKADNQGVMGIQHFERGLMWVETYLSGHMEPEGQPEVTLLHLNWLLGRIDEI